MNRGCISSHTNQHGEKKTTKFSQFNSLICEGTKCDLGDPLSKCKKANTMETSRIRETRVGEQRKGRETDEIITRGKGSI